MLSRIVYRQIEYGSPEQKESIVLREEVLRKPLGLQFNPEELSVESIQIHLAGFMDNSIVAVLLLVPIQGSQQIKMRQVAVADAFQGKGIGKRLVAFSETKALEIGYTLMVLHARKTAVPFYLSMGYNVQGEIFTEVGIPHLKMIKQLQP